MINRSKLARFARIEQAQARLPLRRTAVLNAYAQFRQTGQLPDELRLADAVAQTALNGGDTPEDVRLVSETVRLLTQFGHTVTARVAAKPAMTPSAVRAPLFRQAVHSTGAVQSVAREAIRWLVKNGEDVANPRFAASYGVPKKNSAVGMFVLNWPRCLVRPPFEAEATRLLEHLAVVNERIDTVHFDWDALTQALRAFFAARELPGPGLIRDVVLVFAQMDLLVRGRGVADVRKILALDRVWQAEGEERERAVAEFVRLHRRPESARRR